MSVKRKNEKRNKIKNLMKNSVKIKCCYCNCKDNCKTRRSKEKSEGLGIKTYCSITTNKTKDFIRKNKNNIK